MPTTDGREADAMDESPQKPEEIVTEETAAEESEPESVAKPPVDKITPEEVVGWGKQIKQQAKDITVTEVFLAPVRERLRVLASAVFSGLDTVRAEISGEKKTRPKGDE